MGNWKLARWQEPKTLTRDVLREMRRGRPAGMSRRTLIRRSLGAGVGLWLLEVTGGVLGFLWPNLSRGFGAVITLGDMTTVSGNPAVQGVSLPDGAPAYFSQARTYVQLIDPARGFADGASPDGEGLRHQRSYPLPALPAPGLQAQLLHYQLLVRVPLPRLALRPPGHQDQGARTGTAQHGPLRPHDRGRRAVGRHLEDHPRPSARSPRPARSHPRSFAAGLRVSTTKTVA